MSAFAEPWFFNFKWTTKWVLTSWKTGWCCGVHCHAVTRHLVCILGGILPSTLRWRHNGGDSVSNHQLHDGLLNRLFGRRSKKTSKLCVTGLCVGNSPGTGEFPAQMASNAENVSIWWRHHDQRLMGDYVNQSLCWNIVFRWRKTK